MKKFLFAVMACLSITASFAQVDSLTAKPPKKKIDVSNRPGDHFMLQLSSDHLTDMPDSISSHQQGFSRGFNVYVMFDRPFKDDSKFSFGIGLGVGTSNISFRKMNVNVKSGTTLLPFTPLDSTDHFKRYKLATTFIEIPLEFRYFSNPENADKSWKIAIGAKAGTLVNVHTKGKTLENKNNITINSYTEKENSKEYFNGTRFMATARIGYGIFSVFGDYQINKLLKDGAGPEMHLYQIGLTISGL